MKTPIRWFLLVGAMLVASTAFAAFDSYLKIEGKKGGSRIVGCTDGACVVSDLAPGEYTVSVCTAEGKAPTDGIANHSITSPRDTASGQASGKRMHKPVRITKEWGAALPMLSIAIDEPGVQVSLKIGKSRSNIQNN